MENRWWEYYLVRYFPGSVLGAVITLFLTSATNSPLNGTFAALENLKNSTFLGVSLFAALGFAFCYVASAPILTLHTTRSHLRLAPIKEHWKAKRRWQVVGHALTLTFFITAISYLASKTFSCLVAPAVGLVIGTQLWLILSAIITNFSDVETYYRNLATARSQSAEPKDSPPSPGMEYVTSYRHLREHGNAFGILLLELLLFGMLYTTTSKHSFALWIALWLAPASIAWVAGTALESRFVSRPLSKPVTKPTSGETP